MGDGWGGEIGWWSGEKVMDGEDEIEIEERGMRIGELGI